ncbi:MAG TPA: DUF305 domain-containing protein [Pyrinomonadaceae bacterium]|jgi:uncharacterized protein (DUF305 family)|nr:DUF305 domain-containing protein [Pyrinomonadaceae bacterium]
MKTIAFLLALAFAIFNACERPPRGKEIVHNVTDNANMDHSKMGHAMESSPNAASAPYDLQFIDTMIAHHQGAIDMAQLVDTRAQHGELKTLAKSIIADQQNEIAQMREWRKSWFGEAAPAVNMDLPGMHQGMFGMNLEKLDNLKANEFDVEFVRQMIPHHEGAVAMAEDLKKQEAHAELKTLADNIIKSQSAEIGQMKQWLADWNK